MSMLKKSFLYLCFLVVLGYGAALFSEWFLGLYWFSEKTRISAQGYEREGKTSYIKQEFTQLTMHEPGKEPVKYTDSIYGCRHPGDLDSLELAQGNIETLFIGDSFVYGWGVQDDQTLVYQYAKLRGELPFVLNCGIYSSGTKSHIEQLLRVLRAEPNIRVVYYGIFGNDLLVDLEPPRIEESQSVVENDDHLEASQTKVTVGFRAKLLDYLNTNFHRTLNILIKGGYDQLRQLGDAKRNYSTRRDHTFTNYGAILKRDILSADDAVLRDELLKTYRNRVKFVISELKRRNIELRPFLIPYATVISPDKTKSVFIDLSGEVDDKSVEEYRNFLREIFAEEGIPLVDFHDLFIQNKRLYPDKDLYINKDLHLTPYGNTIVAEVLARDN